MITFSHSIMKLLLLITIVTYAQSANILGLFPFPTKSHVVLVGALLEELASRGHNVTMVSPFPLENPPKNYHDVHLEGLIEDFSADAIKKYNEMGIVHKFKFGIEHLMNTSRKLVSNKDLHNYLATKPKADVVLWLSGRDPALLAVAHEVDAPVIGFAQNSINEVTTYITGNPMPYSYVPSLLLPYGEHMNFLERGLNAALNTIMLSLIHFMYLPYQDRLVQEYFPGAPSIQELQDKVDLILVNSHFITESPRPYLPNVIQIGGFRVQKTEPLPEDIQKYLDNSSQGLIYFSFGSVVNFKMTQPYVLEDLIKTFQKTKLNVLLKSDVDIAGLPDNIKTSKWLPQQAILAHPNTKLFITHAGLGSSVEALYHGVPMICIPFFGDQNHNAEKFAHKGIALKLPVEELNEANLTKIMNEMLSNKSYREKALQLSEIYRNQEINPMDKAVFWVEHVIKHKGAKHLKAQSAYMPWYQYMLLDVACLLICCTLVLAMVLYYSFKLFVKLLFKKKTSKIKQN